MEGVDIFSQDGIHHVRVDSRFYSKDVVMAACYAFMDRFYCRVSGDPQGVIEIALREKPDCGEAISLAGDFENMLLSLAQHESFAKRSKQVRDVIVYKALLGGQDA